MSDHNKFTTTNEKFAKILAERINGGEFENNNFYTLEQRLLWLSHAQFLRKALDELEHRT